MHNISLFYVQPLHDLIQQKMTVGAPSAPHNESGWLYRIQWPLWANWWFLIAAILWTWSPLYCWNGDNTCSTLWIDYSGSFSYFVSCSMLYADWYVMKVSDSMFCDCWLFVKMSQSLCKIGRFFAHLSNRIFIAPFISNIFKVVIVSTIVFSMFLIDMNWFASSNKGAGQIEKQWTWFVWLSILVTTCKRTRILYTSHWLVFCVQHTVYDRRYRRRGRLDLQRTRRSLARQWHCRSIGYCCMDCVGSSRHLSRSRRSTQSAASQCVCTGHLRARLWRQRTLLVVYARLVHLHDRQFFLSRLGALVLASGRRRANYIVWCIRSHCSM